MSMISYECVCQMVVLLFRRGNWDILAYALRLAFNITSRTLMLPSQVDVCHSYAQLFAFRSPFSPSHRHAPLCSPTESCILDLKFDEIRQEFQSRLLGGLIDPSVLPFRSDLMAYYTFEQYWRKSNDEVAQEVYEFEIKEKAIDRLLEAHGINAQIVRSHFLEYDLVSRDPSGWVRAGDLLNIDASSTSLYTLKGVRIEKKTGKIHFIEDRNDYMSTPLLTAEDVALVLANSGRGSEQFPGCFFSLDSIDESHFDLHPLQRFRYGPACMRGSRMLSTLFHTDYLMKQMSIGCEISSLPPFRTRPVSATTTSDSSLLFAGFSAEMRRAFRSTVERELERSDDDSKTRTSKQHRFWIEADEMSYNVEDDENEMRYLFGDVRMVVKCRAQMRKQDGESTDTVGEEAKDDAEHQFANDFTRHYERLAREHYPEFLRLKEICKLQYVWVFLNSYLENLKRMAHSDLTDEQASLITLLLRYN